MKKIIITFVLFIGLTIPASAFYYDNALVNLWNSRRDLQKAFPGNPETNVKLETWAKKYGWKESPELYNYYPDKAVVEKIVDVKTNDRIVALENKVSELMTKLNQIQNGQETIIKQTEIEENWRECWISSKGVSCETTDADWPVYNNGRFNIKFLTK
jgi:hypothetical protein